MIRDPQIFEWLRKGCARYKNHIHGLGGVGTLPVPTQQAVIVTGFKYFSFIDPQGDDPPDFDKRRNTQVTFTSKGNRYMYAIRDSLISHERSATESTNNPFGAFDFECYQVHTTDIAIDILKIETPQSWQPVTAASMPDDSDEPKTVLGGYGQTSDPSHFDTIISQQTGTLLEQPIFLPPGKRGGGKGDVDQFTTYASLNTALRYPTTLAAEVQDTAYPIMNISYVLLNSTISADFLG